MIVWIVSSDLNFSPNTSVCIFRCMFNMFYFGCCICYNGYIYVVIVFSKCFGCFYLDVVCFYLDVAYVAVAIHLCCKYMFQIFHLFSDVCYKYFMNVAYVAVVIHICCKCMFQLFHLLYVCCNRCCSSTCSDSLASTRCTRHPYTTSVVPHGGACNQLNTCACAVCSLPLSHWDTRASLSCIEIRVLWSLFLACSWRSLSYWGTCVVLSLAWHACCVPFLSHAVGRAHAHALPGRHSNSRRHGGIAVGRGGARRSSMRERPCPSKRPGASMVHAKLVIPRPTFH
jgi:hypothetical protein